MEKTTKYLRCHTVGRFVTAGQSYEVISSDAHGFCILDDEGSRHSFTQEKYRRWFTLETGADSAPITLLPDESLGGPSGAVLREYREVKRKACVGELAKITSTKQSVEVGSITKCLQSDMYGDGSMYTELRFPGCGGTGFIDGMRTEYTVLEPTDILVIDGARYTMVDRKAAVGERVIVTGVKSTLSIGAVFVVENVKWAFPAAGLRDGHNAIDGHYAVLEPLTPAEPDASLIDKITDEYAENITVLVRKIAELETNLRVAREDIVLLEEGIGEEIDALSKRIDALECVKKAEFIPPTFTEIMQRKADVVSVKTPQMIRDEIVERAKADLENVKTPRNINADPQPLVYVYKYFVVDVEFVVDRDKRTVVAIARWRKDGSVLSRGIAKAAPGETFNSHIGRAIALRRALGLAVPAEYLTCPQPEEVRVGDVIRSEREGRDFTVSAQYVGDEKYLSLEYVSVHAQRFVITDDSREDGGIPAASSALKGAA